MRNSTSSTPVQSTAGRCTYGCTSASLHSEWFALWGFASAKSTRQPGCWLAPLTTSCVLLAVCLLPPRCCSVWAGCCACCRERQNPLDVRKNMTIEVRPADAPTRPIQHSTAMSKHCTKGKAAPNDNLCHITCPPCVVSAGHPARHRHEPSHRPAVLLHHQPGGGPAAVLCSP